MEGGEVLPQPGMVVVVEALDGGVRDDAVHPLDLTVGPGVLHFGQAMLDAGIPFEEALAVVPDPAHYVIEAARPEDGNADEERSYG